MLRRIRVFQRPSPMFHAMSVHIPNKAPSFAVDKPITSVLEHWKSTPTEPVPIVDILTRKGITSEGKDWASSFRTAEVTNTEHWAALSDDDKKNMKLPKPVISALDTSPEVHQVLQVLQVQLLQRFSITTVGQWQDLSDTDKQEIKKAGMPQAVINDLNKAVRKGLLLPAFKYADHVAFLKSDDHAGFKETRTIIQHGFLVDDGWVLDRPDCDALCVNMQIVTELTQKYFLRRWTSCLLKNKKGEEFFYPKTHELWELHEVILKHKSDTLVIPLCTKSALDFVTQCGENMKYQGVVIPCTSFYNQMQVVDPYLLGLWDAMLKIPPVR